MSSLTQPFQIPITRVFNTINLNQSLLRHKKQTSLWFRFFKKLKIKSTKKALSEFIKQDGLIDQHLHFKQMELIDDPVYTSVLIKEKVSMIKRIADFTNYFKVFEPEATWLIFWNLLIAFIILYYFFEIGLVVFLGQSVWQSELQSTITYTLNIVFILSLFIDIFIQLNTGYYHQGTLIMDKLKIVKHYLIKYFLIDITSVVLVTASFVTQSMLMNYVKIIFYFKIISLHRIDMIYQKILMFYIKWNMVYLVFRQIIIVMVSTHYLGVVFFAIDNYVYTNNYYGPSTPILSWVFNCDAYSQLIWQPWYVWYIYSFYFAIGTMTTIAYGDITPLNPIDTMYVIFVLIVCCIQFSYVLFNIIQIFYMGQAAELKIEQEHVHFNKFLKTNLIPSKLQVKVKAFIEETWNAEMYRDREIEEEMMEKLPKELKRELLSKVYHKFAVELLAFVYPIKLFNDLVLLIEECRCSPQEHLAKKSELIESISYVVSGRVSYYLNPKLHLKTVEQATIGVAQFYTRTQPQFSVVTILDSNIYKIQFSVFQNLIRSDQSYLEIMKNIADQSRQQSRKCQLFNLQCFICQRTNHTTLKCPNSHYLIKDKNSCYFEFQQLRQKFIRKHPKRRLKKYKSHRKQSSKSLSDIRLSNKVSLQEFLEMDLCVELDFNDVDKFVEETLKLLKDIKNGLMIEEKREEERQETFEQMMEYDVYMRNGNIRHVLRSLSDGK